MADKSKIGKEYPPFTWEVEKVKIKELALAIGDENPIYTDSETARTEGYQDTPATPTYITLPMMWNSLISRIMEDLGVDYLRKIVHGGEDYEYFDEIYPGDVLEGRSRIKDITEKTGGAGKMNFISIETTYTNQQKQKVLAANTVIIERE